MCVGVAEQAEANHLQSEVSGLRLELARSRNDVTEAQSELARAKQLASNKSSRLAAQLQTLEV